MNAAQDGCAHLEQPIGGIGSNLIEGMNRRGLGYRSLLFGTRGSFDAVRYPMHLLARKRLRDQSTERDWSAIFLAPQIAALSGSRSQMTPARSIQPDYSGN